MPTEAAIPSEFEHLVKRLCDERAPRAAFRVLRSLSGRSPANVFLVDISQRRGRHDRIADGGPDARIHGQYVLKLVRLQEWDGITEASEEERYGEARDHAPGFFTAHVPRLVAFAREEQRSAILYEVAGGNASGLTAGDGADLHDLVPCCELVSGSLLRELNHEFEVDQHLSAGDMLQEWLGYRLDPNKAPALHQASVSLSTHGRLLPMGERVLTSPLWLCQQQFIRYDRQQARFRGVIHGDLHLGNLLLQPSPTSGSRYWVIDFGLSRRAPLLYDHAYYELSFLLNFLGKTSPEPLLKILHELDQPSPENLPRINADHVGLLHCLQAVRRSIREWQHSSEPGHLEAVEAQALLARVAAALCWANKPLSPAERTLAICYGGWAAHQYLTQFHRDQMTVTLDELQAGAAEVAPVSSAPAATADETWADLWRGLDRFNSRVSIYVLVAGRQDQSPDLAALGMLPWSVVVDLDPKSDVDGLHAAAAPVLGKRRSLSEHGIDQPVAPDFTRGTTWLMAAGWDSRHEEQPSSEVDWRRRYLRAFRDLCGRMRRAVPAQTVHMLVLPGTGLSIERLRAVAEALDDEFEDRAAIAVLGTEASDLVSVKMTAVPISASSFVSSVRQMYGILSDTGLPQLPGEKEPVPISVEMLRQLEADMDVLHTGSTSDAVAAVVDHSEFWRGTPPTWSDLHAQVDVSRPVNHILRGRIEELLSGKRISTVYLLHTPGAGGTTAARRVAWDLSTSYPTLVLRRPSRFTVDRLTRLYQLVKKPMLLLAEASVLPRAAREEFFEELAQRHVRFVILYVERSARPARGEISVAAPMGKREAEDFRTLYSGQTQDEQRRVELAKLTQDEAYARHRIPFFYGLVTYEREFNGLERYVQAHIAGKRYDTCKPLAYLALITRYAQQFGLGERVTKELLRISPEEVLDLDSAFGPTANLIIQSEGQFRLMHPLLAEEVLCQLFGGRSDQWKENLKQLSLDFIRDMARIIGPDSADARHLFVSLFIERDRWVIPGDPAQPHEPLSGRRPFSELLRAIPTTAAQHEVLAELTKLCPDEAHYWNHLGRHRIYALKLDFATAEAHLRKAVELAPDDELHYHSLGMVYRCWARDELDRLFASLDPPAADIVLQRIEHLAAAAADAFARARELSPESEYGYIGHVQMILEIVDRIQRAAAATSQRSPRNISSLVAGASHVSQWVAANLSLVEDLIARVQYQRADREPSPLESMCKQRMARIYGEYQDVINAWERLLRDGADRPDIRRLLAGAYHARRDRAWNKLPAGELRRIVGLMDDNLQSGMIEEWDLRYWFQAYRRLPEFSCQRAISQLEAWVPRATSPDAHYYLYIMHFLRWVEGQSANIERIQYHIEQCRALAAGRRSRSYEWLGASPQWCPLVHQSELGEWDTRVDFWGEPGLLRRLEGVVQRFERGGSGLIRLAPGLTAFFVPARAGLWESEDINAVVNFYLGFSYEGLRAWSPRKGPLRQGSSDMSGTQPTCEEASGASGPQACGAEAPQDAIEEQSDAGAIQPLPDESGTVLTANMEDAPRASVDRSLSLADLAAATEREVRGLVARAEETGRPLLLGEVAAHLAQMFDSTAVYRTLGHKRLTDLLSSYAGLAVQSAGGRSTLRAATDDDIVDLSRRVTVLVIAFVEGACLGGGTTSLKRIRARLAQEFPGRDDIHLALGHPALEDLLRSIPSILVEGRAGELRVRPAPKANRAGP